MRSGGLLLATTIAFGSLGGVAAIACSSDDGSTFGNGGGGPGSSGGSNGIVGATPDGAIPGCVNLQCAQKTDCPNGTTTSLTGKVFDPAGKVPLFNVTVYVPNGEPDAITPGLSGTCDRCDGKISGSPIASTTTDATGSFKLDNVPADTDFRIVMQIGKWRRIIPVPKVTGCQSAAIDPAQTRLPRNRSEGDIPRIALATGGADPFECLFRKIGLEDSEFGQAGSDARVQLYVGGGATTLEGPKIPTSSFADGGAAFTSAPTLWDDPNQLKLYDIVVLACEGDTDAESKPVNARQALIDYGTAGGRVFTSHFHHYWFSHSPEADVVSLATWTNDFTCTPPGPSCPVYQDPAPTTEVDAVINTGFPKGQAMHDWLSNTNSLTGAGGTLPIFEASHNVDGVSTNLLSWMTIANPAAGGRIAHEYVSFNTPVGATEDQVCGRVVYSDLHVGAGDHTNTPFPNGCITSDLTPQQKALEFMLFDLSSCIQKDDAPITK